VTRSNNVTREDPILSTTCCNTPDFRRLLCPVTRKILA